MLKNRVQIIGHLGIDPKIVITPSGKKCARFSIATNETFKNKAGERISETHWHNCIAWGKTAECIEKYTCKGVEIAIDGKLLNSNYIDHETGVKRYMTEIEIDEILILSKPPKLD